MSRARFLAGRSGGAGGPRRPYADNESSEGPRVLPESIEVAWTMGYIAQVAECLMGHRPNRPGRR